MNDEKKEQVNTQDSMGSGNIIMDFDDMRDESKESQETNELKAVVMPEVDSYEEQEESVEKKKESKKEESAEKQKDSKKEESAEKKEEPKKEDSVEKKEDSKKEESANQKEESKKEDSAKKKEESEKEESTEQKEESKKDASVEKKAGADKAVSQSKKIADAKAANENKEKMLEPKKKKGKGFVIAACSILAVLLAAYVAGFVYFSGHFYQSVKVNGVDVSNMSTAIAKTTLDTFYQNYKLTIKTIDDSTLTLNGNDIGMQIKLSDDFASCTKQQEPYLWFVNYFKPFELTAKADASWNKDALDKQFAKMDILKKDKMVEPQDACVGVEEGKYAIVKEVMGSTLDIDQTKATIEGCLAVVNSELDLKEAKCYQLPKVYSDDEALQNEYNAKSVYSDREIKLQLDDLTLEPGMELYENILEKNGDTYVISDKKVSQYVKDLAEQYDSLGKDREFTTSWNDRVIYTHGDAFGYVMNQEKTLEALKTAIQSEKPATVEVVFDQKGYSLIGNNDIGDSYIEVNLSEQYVYAYKDGKKIAEGDCVSGNESLGHGTCIGLYAIQDKKSPTVLRGERKPVTKTVTKKKKGKKVKVEKTEYEYEYESPVTFWMQFNGGIGLHDATAWRSAYGGSIYYYSGSHGCVNLPYDLAKKLYENYEVGAPVIVYFWDNENRK